MKVQTTKITAEDIKAHADMGYKKRRTLIKKYKIRKMSNSDLATLFSVSISQIEKDMAKIRDEIYADLKTDGGAQEVLKTIVTELQMVNDEVVEAAWNLADGTKQDSVKLGCLKLVRDSQSDIIKAMQSLGIVDEAAKKFDISLQDKLVEEFLNETKKQKTKKGK